VGTGLKMENLSRQVSLTKSVIGLFSRDTGKSILQSSGEYIIAILPGSLDVDNNTKLEIFNVEIFMFLPKKDFKSGKQVLEERLPCVSK
jgi:hypothetical protein